MSNLSEMTPLEFYKSVAKHGLSDTCDVSDIGELLAECAELRRGLELIASDPHCSYDHPEVGSGQYGIGVADGHRCAARKAQAVLAAVEGRKA